MVDHDVITRALDRLGYEVTVVPRAAEALALLRHSRAAVVIAAAQLPDATAHVLGRHLRHEMGSSAPPLVIFGAREEGEVSEQVAELDYGAQLTTPLSVPALVAIMRRLAERAEERVPAGNPPAQQAPAMDQAHLESFTQGDRQLERELGALFLSNAIEIAARLRASLDDPEQWRAAAHLLKGTSANIGARALAEVAARAERHPPCPSLLEEIEMELGAIHDFFAAR